MSKRSAQVRVQDALAILNPGGSLHASVFSEDGSTFVTARNVRGNKKRVVRIFYNEGRGFVEAPMLMMSNTRDKNVVLGERVGVSAKGDVIAVGGILTDGTAKYHIYVYEKQLKGPEWILTSDVEIVGSFRTQLQLTSITVASSTSIFADRKHTTGNLVTRFNITKDEEGVWDVTSLAHTSLTTGVNYEAQ